MKKHYVLYLIPSRSSFALDMTSEERVIMQQHVAYWTDLMNKGLVLLFGPVMDPAGAYGLGIVRVDDEAQLNEIMANDPANGLNKYEVYPMRAVYPGSQS
jgi:hypothetical protein